MVKHFNNKVLQVLPHLNDGGVPQGCIDIAQALVDSGKTAYIASAGGKRCAELSRMGACHIDIPLDTKNPVQILSNAFRLSALIRKEGIGLIHARSRAPAWSSLWAARLTGIPFVTTFHGTYNFNNFAKQYYNSVMARGDRVIAISHFIEQHIIKNYKSCCCLASIRLVHRGIDLENFSFDHIGESSVKELRQRWGVKDHQKLILMPGRLTRWKGQKVVLQALACLPSDGFKCVLVGSDQGRVHYKQELEAFVREKGLMDSVVFQDTFPSMPLAYAACDVVVHASSDPEAFGRVIAEAQAMGKPVIASNLGAPREIVLEGITGWLFSPSSPHELANALIKLKEMAPDLLKAAGEKARKNVEDNFSYEQMTRKTLEVYAELLESAQP